MIEQKGYNSKFPKFLKDIWRIGDKVPEWLSDKAKVTFIDGLGNKTIERRDLTTGGYEIVSADGIGILCSVKSREDYVCLASDGYIFPLGHEKMRILYGKPNKH